MRHHAPRPYETRILMAVFISIASATVLYARPANRISSIDVNPRDVVTPKMPMVVSNASPFDPTSLCQQCHVAQTDEWTESMHYLAWRDPVFQAFYAEYLDYLAPEGRPGRLPGSIYTAGDKPEPRQEDVDWALAMNESGYLGTTTEELNMSANADDPNAAYLGMDPTRDLESTLEDYEAELEERRQIVTKLDPIAEIVHGDGLMAEGFIDGKVQMNCLKCHAPGADITLDTGMKLENNTQGVFCDYCHTVVDRTDQQGYILMPGKFKQGPILNALAASHVIEFSRLHTQSEFCKSCHQQRNPYGVAVYNSYNEWYDSPYAQSINETNCQSCHMASGPGRAAIQGDERPDIHNHRFSGSDDRAFLYEAATVGVEANVEGSDLYIDCDVVNDRAGHNFPTDSPLRELVLIVRLKGPSGETLWQGKRVYSRIWGDAEGNMTYNNWEAAQILADTTLRPRESRKESFQVPLPEVDGQMYVTAQLFFRRLPEDARFLGVENIPQPFRLDHATAFLP